MPFVSIAGLTLLASFCSLVALPRWRMERRSGSILRTMSDDEETTEYLRLDSPWPRAKRKAMESRIAKMANDGWVFLKASEASARETRLTLGGG